MKKLGKLDIDSMEREFQVLENPEKILGGGFVSAIDIVGGSITNWNYNGYKYATFISADGRCLVLEGINVGNNTLPFQQDDTACYFGGDIRIGHAFLDFNFNDLKHEYGHYIQSKNMATIQYLFGSIGSMVSILRRNEDHMSRPFEQDATMRGSVYATTYYGFPTSY